VVIWFIFRPFGMLYQEKSGKVDVESGQTLEGICQFETERPGC
jgi:hypothetical protein